MKHRAMIAAGIGLVVWVGGLESSGAGEAAKAKTDAPEPYALPRDIELDPCKLDLGAKLRLRYEWFNNYNLKTYGTNKSDEALGEKLWLDFGYRVGENARAFLRLQDAHFWLSEFDADDFSPHCSHHDPLDVREAHLDLRKIGGSPVGVKAGRQIIMYADQRVWTAGDWANSGGSWDGIKLMWQSAAADVDGIYARRVIANPDRFNADYQPFDAWGVYAVVKNLPFALDIFHVLKQDQHRATAGESGTNRLALNAVGARVNWKPVEGAEVGGTFAREFGDWGDDELDAWGGVASAGYTAPAAWKPGAKLSYTYASGDSNPSDGKRETFDMLFGSAASYYGLMNLLAWMNLRDYQVDFTATPPGLDKIALSYHLFQLAEAKDAWYHSTARSVRRDTTGQSGKDIGQEVDLVLSKKVNGNLSVDVAFCHFFAGKFAEATGKGKDADWACVMTTLTF
ncbi:MAG: alginate export family protein [Verrucomicrobiota bacterium]|nr:alginate export family protein [Verrucomicrobiota bacterium]